MYKYKYFNNVQCANIQFIFEASVALQIYDYTIAVTLIAEKYIHVRTVILKYRYKYSWIESPSIPQHWIVQGFKNFLVCVCHRCRCYAFNCALPNQMKICFIFYLIFQLNTVQKFKTKHSHWSMVKIIIEIPSNSLYPFSR